MIEPPSSTPIQMQPSSSKLPLVLVGLILMLTAGAGGVLLGKYLYGPKTPQISTSVTPTPRAEAPTATSSPDVTSNWETYINKKYNYSLQYPESLYFSEIGDGLSIMLSSLKPPVPLTQTPWVISLTVRQKKKLTDTRPLYLQVNNFDDYEMSIISKNITVEDVFINGVKSEKVTGLPSQSGALEVFTPHEDKIFHFALGPYDPKMFPFTEISVDTFDQILSTFRFLDRSDVTSNWQIHVDSETGYSIQYPQDWRKVQFQGVSKGIGVGPIQVGEDVLWAVNVYDVSQKSRLEVVEEIGNQFLPDRRQTEEQITVNGVRATKVTTTTREIKDWYSVTILFENKGRIITISNGAIGNEKLATFPGVSESLIFEDFYSTFKLL